MEQAQRYIPQLFNPKQSNALHIQVEAGELIDARHQPTDNVEHGELLTPVDAGTADSASAGWAVDSAKVEDVRSGDVTIFKSVGVGVQDVAIACAVVDRAVKDGIGRLIDDYDEEL